MEAQNKGGHTKQRIFSPSQKLVEALRSCTSCRKLPASTLFPSPLQEETLLLSSRLRPANSSHQTQDRRCLSPQELNHQQAFLIASSSSSSALPSEWLKYLLYWDISGLLYVPAWYYKRSGAVGADDFSSLRHKILWAKFNISVSAPKISDWSRGVTHFYRT